MATSLRYETPENIQLQYQAAGLGTRFVAWFIDSIFLHAAMLVVFLVLLLLAAASDVMRGFFDSLFQAFDSDRTRDPEKVGTFLVGIALLVWGLSSFVYYGLSEWLLGGQTIGKRICKIRVVKAEGFALDTVSVLVRNLFRVIDHLPLLWVVPLLSSQSQRLGDLAAGTLVVSDKARELPSTRSQLIGRSAGDTRYRFDHGRLQRLRPSDFEAVERLLEAWERLPSAQRQEVVSRMLPALCKRMQLDEPVPDDRQLFFEDLLAAEYRRQERRLV